MIPGGDHSSRSLLFRRVRSWSDVSHRPRDDDTAGESSDGRFQQLRQPLLHLTPFERDDSDDGNLEPPMPPTLEYEEESDQSSVHTENELTEVQEDHSQQNCSSILATMDWKLWTVFGFLVASGVGNVIFAKLQSQPMYNYPTFLNIYTNGMYVLMSFAYILPASSFGLFGNSFPHSIPTRAIKPFFVMGALDALCAAMQILATMYLPGTLLLLIPQFAIPLSMAAGSLILRERYTVRQYVGATVVFSAILVVLYPILTHQRDADYYCEAIHTENDCLLCKEATTEESCISHNSRGKDANHRNSTLHLSETRFWRDLGVTDDDDYCAWMSREEDAREEDVLVFFWSIVMLLSCVPSVMSTVYKQVALQTASSMDPIVISGWVSLFQFICGLFLVIPSGLFSSPKVNPLELGSNWLDGIGCLFAQINAIDSGCHPDNCARAALWVHLSLLNSAVYALSMLFVLKYGSCDLMYLGLTLVVPLGHFAFDIDSSLSELRVYDIVGLIILVAGLVLYRFGHGKKARDVRGQDTVGRSISDHEHGERFYRSYHLVANREGNSLGNESAETTSGGNNNNNPGNFNRQGTEGFLEFLREPFMLAGDI